MLVFFLDLILYSSTLTTILPTPLHHWHWQCMLACHPRHCTNHLMISGTAHYVPTLWMNTNSISKHWASSPFRQNQHHQERGEYKLSFHPHLKTGIIRPLMLSLPYNKAEPTSYFSLMLHRACCHTCYTIQLVHYSHLKTQSLQHLKPIKC